MTHRGPCQPLLFCDSVVWEDTSVQNNDRTACIPSAKGQQPSRSGRGSEQKAAGRPASHQGPGRRRRATLPGRGVHAGCGLASSPPGPVSRRAASPGLLRVEPNPWVPLRLKDHSSCWLLRRPRVWLPGRKQVPRVQAGSQPCLTRRRKSLFPRGVCIQELRSGFWGRGEGRED